ncbi:MAG: alkaline phosphatase, partial [Curvibacter sp.]
MLAMAGAIAGGLWLPDSAHAQPRLASDPFALGVASGSPRHDSVVLWTRLVQAQAADGAAWGTKPVAVRWEVAHDEGFQRMVQTGSVNAVPELAHSVHVQ